MAMFGRSWLEDSDEDDFEGMALAISGAMKEDIKREQKEMEDKAMFPRMHSWEDED